MYIKGILMADFLFNLQLATTRSREFYRKLQSELATTAKSYYRLNKPVLLASDRVAHSKEKWQSYQSGNRGFDCTLGPGDFSCILKLAFEL